MSVIIVHIIATSKIVNESDLCLSLSLMSLFVTDFNISYIRSWQLYLHHACECPIILNYACECPIIPRIMLAKTILAH